MGVKIDRKAYNKVYRFAKKMGASEIGGLLFGKVTGKEGHIVVNDAVLLKQTASPGQMVLDENALMDFTKNASAKKLKSVIGWWHSHGHGMAFWSTTDDECFRRLANFSGFCFGMVVGHGMKKTEAFRVDIATKEWGVVSLDDLIVDVESQGFWKRNKLTEKEEKEIAKKVKEEVICYDPDFYGSGYGEYGGRVVTLPSGMNKDTFDDNSGFTICPKCKGEGVLYRGRDNSTMCACNVCDSKGYLRKKQHNNDKSLEDEAKMIDYVG